MCKIFEVSSLFLNRNKKFQRYTYNYQLAAVFQCYTDNALILISESIPSLIKIVKEIANTH